MDTMGMLFGFLNRILEPPSSWNPFWGFDRKGYPYRTLKEPFWHILGGHFWYIALDLCASEMWSVVHPKHFRQANKTMDHGYAPTAHRREGAFEVALVQHILKVSNCSSWVKKAPQCRQIVPRFYENTWRKLSVCRMKFDTIFVSTCLNIIYVKHDPICWIC